MYTAILVLHLIVCLFLIFIILIQSSKGSEMGAAFGGSNQTLFGSRGAATFLNKLTTGAAIMFMLTSLTLAIISTGQQGSVMSSAPAAKPAAGPIPDQPSGPLQEQPAAPGQGEVQETPAPAQPEEKAE
jgi:preprotein translocase subunit SecG